MSVASALLAQQPVAFWLAVVGLLTAAAIALGDRLAVAAALGAALGALVAAVDPGVGPTQAAGAVLGTGAVLGLGLMRRRSAAAASPREDMSGAPMPGDVRLLGRTARTRAAFVGGQGEVEVDGAARPARALAPDEFLDGATLVRIVRVGDPALVVRPVPPPAG